MIRNQPKSCRNNPSLRPSRNQMCLRWPVSVQPHALILFGGSDVPSSVAVTSASYVLHSCTLERSSWRHVRRRSTLFGMAAADGTLSPLTATNQHLQSVTMKQPGSLGVDTKWIVVSPMAASAAPDGGARAPFFRYDPQHPVDLSALS